MVGSGVAVAVLEASVVAVGPAAMGGVRVAVWLGSEVELGTCCVRWCGCGRTSRHSHCLSCTRQQLHRRLTNARCNAICSELRSNRL
jgi:hypothetical protein